MSELKQDQLLLKELLINLIREEQRGRLFFREAAKVSTDSEIIELFEWLSAQEQEHLEILEKMKSQLDAELKKHESPIPIDGKLINILDLSDMDFDKTDLPRVDLFKNQDFVELLKAVSVQAILKYAMQIEYQNAAYIKEFITKVHSKKIRAILVGLIQDEKNHFQVLQKKLQKITSK